MKHIVIMLILVQQAFGAFERQPAGGRTAAMGNSLIADRGNVWSAVVNPGALVTVSTRSVSFSYTPRPFGLHELAYGTVSYIEPTSVGAFALSGTRFGFELYREVTLSLAYGNSLTSTVHVGISMNLYSLAIERYGSASTAGVDFGLLVDLSDDVHWGFTAFNVHGAMIGSSKEKLPQVFSTGITYNPLGNAVVAVGLEKDVRYAAELRIGAEYMILEMIGLRIGSTSEPSTLNGGIGVRYLFFNVDYAVTSHPELGLYHHFSLTITL